MRDDLVEIIAAMVERRRQILPEEPVEQARPAHQRQRIAHHPPRALEDEHGQQCADGEIEIGRIAVANNEVLVENPLVETAEETRGAGQPGHHAARIAFRGEITDQPERQQQDKADMNAAHDLAGQNRPCRDDELECSKGDTDAISEVSPPTGAKSFRKSMFEIIEFDSDLAVARLGRI